MVDSGHESEVTAREDIPCSPVAARLETSTPAQMPQPRNSNVQAGKPKDLYIDELKDLWSPTNNQMHRCLKKIATKASDSTLKEMLSKSLGRHRQAHRNPEGADRHEQGESVEEHCKGMEGLAAEAIKHTTEEAPDKGPVLDAQIIAQYQRMSHYGIAGFGTVTAYAKELGLKDDYKQLAV